jgi:hypothetical protein
MEMPYTGVTFVIWNRLVETDIFRCNQQWLPRGALFETLPGSLRP